MSCRFIRRQFSVQCKKNQPKHRVAGERPQTREFIMLLISISNLNAYIKCAHTHTRTPICHAMQILTFHHIVGKRFHFNVLECANDDGYICAAMQHAFTLFGRLEYLLYALQCVNSRCTWFKAVQLCHHTYGVSTIVFCTVCIVCMCADE